MSEEVTDEQSEAAEEKSLDEQIALLEGIATALEEEAEVKSDETEAEEDSEAKAEDDTEEKGFGEADHSEEECKDMEKCPWHGPDAKEAEEPDSEEKSADDEKAHPVATGYPYDRVEMQPGDPEFDEEEDEKNEMVVPKKRRIVVVEVPERSDRGYAGKLARYD